MKITFTNHLNTYGNKKGSSHIAVIESNGLAYHLISAFLAGFVRTEGQETSPVYNVDWFKLYLEPVAKKEHACLVWNAEGFSIKFEN